MATLATAGAVDLDQPPIEYWETSTSDVVSQLQAAVESGEHSLQAETHPEMLKAVLDYLGVPAESQVLVFSRTSAQNSRIFPERPRAVYFSDDCYVGWVQGGSIETMSFDPEVGAVFHLIKLPPAGTLAEPTFSRPQDCLSCHESSATRGIPGGLVRSVHPGPKGLPYFEAGTFRTDDSSPLSERWGGWYVTGRAGDQIHMGNQLAVKTDEQIVMEAIAPTGTELDDLQGVIDTTSYPGGASSDIVALMVLEHQVQMHNTLSQANQTVRQLWHRTEQMHENFGEPMPNPPEGTLKRVIESQAGKIVDGLLFRHEFRMSKDGVDGGDAFRDDFEAEGLPAEDGRSLRDLRLYERLFRYRCSYVIYSDVFDHLTPVLKEEVYQQLWTALEGSSGTDASNHMTWTERERVRDILAETKDDLPGFWQSSGGE